MDADAPTLDEGGRAILTGISSRAFEHPADGAALTALRSLPGFDQILRRASGMLRERQYRLAFLASSVRVGPRQFADLNRLFDEVTTVLDAPERPELFVFNDPQPNAITLGVDRPFIAMSSGLYELTDDAERRVVLGHELGHALAGHALYRSLLMHLLNLAGAFGWVPAGGLGLRALIAALREWERKAELSGDRAGLLASQDPDAALRLLMKTAGGAHLDRIDPDAFLEQAAEYEGSGDLRDGVLKLLNTETTTHPFAVVRAAELHRWAQSPEYAAILQGAYPHRSDDRDASFSDSARDAARSYKKRIDESTDPLVSTVRNVGTSVGQAADSVVDWFTRRARSVASAGAGATDRADDDDSTTDDLDDLDDAAGYDADYADPAAADPSAADPSAADPSAADPSAADPSRRTPTRPRPYRSDPDDDGDESSATNTAASEPPVSDIFDWFNRRHQPPRGSPDAQGDPGDPNGPGGTATDGTRDAP